MGKIGLEKIYFEREISQADELDFIKNCISSWSNNIPGNELLRDLGEKIELSKVVDCPVYLIGVEALREKRTVIEGKSPYSPKIQEIYYDSRDVISENWFSGNPWNLSLPVVSDFLDYTEMYIIPSTFRVYTCEYCKGKGEIECPVCGGSGKIECPECGGYGWLLCRRCGGKGKIEVWRHGYKIKEECPYCNGRREFPCPLCKGERKINCPRCGGCLLYTSPSPRD